MPLINRAFRWRNWKRGQPTTTIIKGASTTFNGLPNSSQTATTHTHKKVIQFPSARMLLLLLPVCHIRLFPFSLLLLLPPRFYPSSREALRPAKKKENSANNPLRSSFSFTIIVNSHTRSRDIAKKKETRRWIFRVSLDGRKPIRWKFSVPAEKRLKFRHLILTGSIPESSSSSDIKK